MKGKVDPCYIGVGSNLIFSTEEETCLVEHLECIFPPEYGYTNVQVQQLVVALVDHVGKRPTNKQFSKNWLYGFLKRWKDRLSSINQVPWKVIEK
ncbi:hypothetical protein DPMN_040707 [Dreissena polymorpha]|uniref:HTH CENPB-type domain-containing protein n=1 Tax=Dreissena polymorpha TaxID=45954 RepID=A0A9D4CYT7_DREPO|nr:hypothetical protein DPMN_040707 [Dreissena polymorpha]